VSQDPGRTLLTFLSHFLDFLRVRKRFWLVPMLVTLLLFGLLLAVAQNSAIAPVIYALLNGATLSSRAIPGNRLIMVEFLLRPAGRSFL
jgi:hypothetical protein